MAASGEQNPTESQGADQMVSQQQGQPQQDQDNDNEGAEKLVEGMMTVRQAMQTFGDNLAGTVPPEGIKALHVALQAYDQFLSIAQKAMGVNNTGEEQAASAPQGPQSAMSQGRSNVVPADQPSRPGMQRA